MNASLETPSSSPRVLPAFNPARAFGGVWRLTIRRFLAPRHALAAFGAIAVLGLLAWLQARHDPDFINWISNSYLSFLVPLIAFVTAGGAMRDEMKSATADYVLTRAIPRPAFLAFKYAAYVVGAEIEFLLALVVLTGVGLSLHVPGLAAAIPTLVIAQAGLVLAFSGFGFLCGALTSRYIIVGLIYGAIVEIGVGQIPTQLNRLSMTRQVRELVEPFLNTVASTTPGASHAGLFSTALVLLAFALATLVGAIAVFSLRELADRADG